MIRWFVVRVVAFALRHGATEDDLFAALGRAYRRKPQAWHHGVIFDARNHNRDRKALSA